MAKRNLKIEIVDKELTPTIIGKLDTKEKSPVILIFIFAILLAVALFLPDINNYVTKLLTGKTNSNTPIVNPNNKVNNSDTEKEPETEEKFYTYTSDLVITNDLFSISNIVYDDASISFNINNLTEQTLDLGNYKYFLEVYSVENTLLQRIKISFDTFTAHETKNYNYSLDMNVSTGLNKFLLLEKKETDYPEVVLNKDENNNGILTCTKGIENISYTFGNDYLININDIINYPISSDINYTNALNNYQIMAATYNNYNGVSSTLITTANGFTFTTLVDLKTADIKQMNNNYYYAYKTLAKTVKFEMESNGFSCN